ncbi:MAG: CDP-alcohol phosphatidyltransferase family protein [Oligoflexia bacterium]|nr:CDP-alcohol phosphatidyltransferase family protein [Oligoflexia bacterium]
MNVPIPTAKSIAIFRPLNTYIGQYRQSIKSWEAEEKLDLFFYRPLGFLCAKTAKFIGISPTEVTVLGIFSGLAAAFCFWQYVNLPILSGRPGFADLLSFYAGVFFFLLSGILDSADGQLARLTGKSSRVGLVLDGVADNIVFTSVYIAAISALIRADAYGPYFFFFALLAGFAHSNQSAMLDFMHREYLYFGCGKNHNDDYWNPTLEEARNFREKGNVREIIVPLLRYSWIWQQQKFSVRSSQQRMRMKAKLQELSDNGGDTDHFSAAYRSYNRYIISFWRLLGSNFHTFAIIFFIFIRHFEWYLLWVDLLGLNLVMVVANYWQKKQDEKFFKLFAI